MSSEMSSELATMYVWDGNTSFDMEYACRQLGGRDPPTMSELAEHHCTTPFFTTRSMVLYKCAASKSIIHEFLYGGTGVDNRTPLLEERLKNIGLDLPDHEILFAARRAKGYQIVDELELLALARKLYEEKKSKVLLVPGSDIEGKPWYISPNIESKVEPAPTGESEPNRQSND